MVVLPTTEIIESHFALPFFYLENKYCNFQMSFTKKSEIQDFRGAFLTKSAIKY